MLHCVATCSARYCVATCRIVLQFQELAQWPGKVLESIPSDWRERWLEQNVPAYNTLTIDVPQLKITQFKPSVSGPGEVSVPVTGRGVIDPSSSYALQFTLINTRQIDL